MAQNLVESYKNRLAISESVHQKSHNGAKMSAQKKLMIASVLNNTSKFMTEAFENSGATQRADMGDYKRFCLNIATIALPNLILPELMLVSPMSSLTGYITYLRYTAGTKKGGVEVGDTFNSVYRLGQMTPERMAYSSSFISETHKVTADEAANLKFSLDWFPVKGISAIKDSSNNVVDPTKYELNAAEGIVDFTKGGSGYILENQEFKVLYEYDNEIIPQTVRPTSLPTLTANMEMVNLHAHARRIAVYYSQIAAFQAKNDYGYDLGQQLAAQAQGELAYEIDSEGVMMLYNGAEEDPSLTIKAYSGDKAISRSQYYEMFTEVIARAKAIIYQRTQKFAPNYMVVSADVLTVMPYLKGWTAAPASVVNGPYFAGTVDGVRVYVSPAMKAGEFFFGVNGSDLQTSAAVYAPYMAIVPTQLLGFADGTMSQGFSTMYDMKLLSTYNVVKDVEGKIIKREDADNGEFSWLLVKGKMVTPTSDAIGFDVHLTNDQFNA